MEKVLRKLAQQLNIYDEASLMALWDSLSEQVASFEPTKEWEEAVLMLSMVQAVRWKNQLFNLNWSESLRAGSRELKKKGQEETLWPGFSLEKTEVSPLSAAPADGAAAAGQKRGKVLSFRPVKDDKPI